jgi:hypothetical protein
VLKGEDMDYAYSWHKGMVESRFESVVVVGHVLEGMADAWIRDDFDVVGTHGLS